MTDQEVQTQLQEANEHLMHDRWDQAVACLNAVLAVIPDNKTAQDSRRRAMTMKAIAAQIMQDIDTARTAVAAGRYHEAWAALERCQFTGIDTGILMHQLDIELMRNDLLQRMLTLARVGSALVATRLPPHEIGGKKELMVLDNTLQDLPAGQPGEPPDPTLSEFTRLVRDRRSSIARARTTHITEAVRARVQRGEWTEARAMMDGAHTESADLPELGAELTRLDRTIRLWQEIERLTVDGVAKSNSNSLRDAQDAFREVLRRALDPDSGLPTQVRDQVAELLTLEKRLDVEASSQHAQALHDHLTMAEAGQNRLVQTYLALPVTLWFQLASRGAMVKAIDSLLALKRYEDAYELAKRAVNKDPDDDYAVNRATEARREIKKRLLDSVTALIEQAQALRDKGAFPEALADLDRIDNECIGPVAARFPETTGGDPDLEDLLCLADDLRTQIAHDLASVSPATEYLSKLLHNMYIREGPVGVTNFVNLIRNPREEDLAQSIHVLSNRIDKLEALVAHEKPISPP